MKFSLKKPKVQGDGQDSLTAPVVERPKLGGKSKLGKPKFAMPKSQAKVKGKKPAKPKKQKEKFDFKKFKAEVESINGQNYGSAPLPVKILMLIMVFVLILVAAWFGLLSKKIDDIKSAESTQSSLLQSYRDKESKARYLTEYERQVEQMRVDFAELLNQLPRDTRVPELVQGINMKGQQSNIRFQDISVKPEVEREFFIEQPIQIIGVGKYHQFGDFVSGIAALPRIMTMHDFEIKNPKPKVDVMPELQLVLQTKTYRAKQVDLDEATDTQAQGGQ